MAQRAKPISPHLQIYRFTLTMLMSISQRATGIAQYAGTLLLVLWLLAAAIGGGFFDGVNALFGSWFGPAWRSHFAAVVCAEDVAAKKPDPEAYTVALQRLGLTAAQAFALEDSPNGLAAARAAGIACGITRSVFFAEAVFEGAAWVQDDLETPLRVTL